jgi:isocitrate dehydrogenase
VELETEYYDLGLERRNDTDDAITNEAALAIKRYGVGVKCATITPNARRVEEYKLKEMWKSPNGTIRTILDGTVFREPIVVKNIKPYVRTWERPIIIARHAYGDVYSSVEIRAEGPGTAKMVFTDENGDSIEKEIFKFTSGGGVLQGMHNTDESISNFAHSCFKYAYEKKMDLWFATKDTISKTYDHRFKDIFLEIYENEYREMYEKESIDFFYTLIDDVVARVISGKGGMVWACRTWSQGRSEVLP